MIQEKVLIMIQNLKQFYTVQTKINSNKFTDTKTEWLSTSRQDCKEW